MWSTTVIILSAIFSQCQALGGEIPDVTTIYKLVPRSVETSTGKALNVSLGRNHSTESESPCINGVYGHVHARTNALGMGFVDKDDKVIVYTKNVEPSKINFDANRFDDSDFTGWTTKDGDKLIIDLMPGNPIKSGIPYNVRESMMLNITITETALLVFTQGIGTLQRENIYIALRFFINYKEFTYNTEIRGPPCGARPYPDGYFEIPGQRYGATDYLYCGGYETFSSNRPNEYLTIDFNKEVGIIKIYKGNNKTLVKDYSDEGKLHINYFSISPSRNEYMEHNGTNGPIANFVYRVTEVTHGGITSPSFTPQSDNICLSMFFHSSNTSNSTELEIFALGLTGEKHSLGTIHNVKSGWNVRSINLSLKDLSPIKLSIAKKGLTKISIARIAICSPDGEEVMELPTPVTVCPKHIFNKLVEPSLSPYSTITEIIDPIEKIWDKNHTCWNKGELTSAGCACPPGFIGSRCEKGCGRNRFGQDCKGLCSLHTVECQGLLMCTKFIGCACAPGYSGDDCTQTCASGWYGNECSQRCGHCAGNSTCDIYTGECPSCEEGYLAPYCKLGNQLTLPE